MEYCTKMLTQSSPLVLPDIVLDNKQNHMEKFIRQGSFVPEITKNMPESVSEPCILLENMENNLREIHKLQLLRSYANIAQVSNSHLSVYGDNTEINVSWGYEEKTDNPNFIQTSIKVHEMHGKILLNSSMLQDTSLNVQEWLEKKISYHMAQAEDRAFIYGDGNNQPEGLLSKNNLQKIKVLSHDEKADYITDSLLAIISRLDKIYLGKACWFMDHEAFSKVLSQKNAVKDYLIQYFNREKIFIFGYPVVLLQNLQLENNRVIIFGNMEEAYQIVDRQDMHLTRDPYTKKPHVEFNAIKRVGGALVNHKALIYLLIPPYNQMPPQSKNNLEGKSVNKTTSH